VASAATVEMHGTAGVVGDVVSEDALTQVDGAVIHTECAAVSASEVADEETVSQRGHTVAAGPSAASVARLSVKQQLRTVGDPRQRACPAQLRVAAVALPPMILKPSRIADESVPLASSTC